MAGKLDPVSQSFSADTSKYVRGIEDAVAANIVLTASVDDVIRKTAEVSAALGKLPDSKSIRITADTSKALADIAAVNAALGALSDREVTVRVRYVTEGAPPDAGSGVAVGRSIAGSAGDSGMSAMMLREMRDTSASLDMLTSSLGRAEEHLAGIRQDLAAARAGGGPQGGGGGGDRYNIRMAAPRDASAQARDDAAAAYYVARTAQIAAAAGGGGGPGGGTPSFVPWRGGGWNAVRFWGMMSAEVLSTVVPAAVAAGAAALVGMQGGEQLANRYKAVAGTAESIGGAYGQTAGSYIVGGPNGSALQNAQNAATGGVYELAGAGINLLRMGAGQGLMTQGVGTIGMLDRASANMLLNWQKNNTGAKLADALGGGTNYLRQFGAIAGNLGNTALDVAPFLPGIGSDLLGGLMGGTGLLARGAGMMTNRVTGPILGGLLAAEAASRWGPAILGGQGLIGRMLGLRGAGGIGGLLGKGGEALFARGAGGILGDLGLGMVGAGEGIAGLGALPLAGMGAAGYGLWQLANIKPAADRQMSGLQSQVNQAGFTQAWQPLAHAIVQSYAGAANQATVKEMTSLSSIGAFGAGGGAWVTNQGLTDAAYNTGFTSNMADLVNSGPQLVKALQGGPNPLSNVSTAQAYQIAQMALLNVSNAFGKNGQLTPTAIQQLQNYGSGIRPMTQSGGAFGAAVSGQYIMSQSAMKDVSSLNQAMDSLTTIMTAGPVGFSALSAAGAGLGTALGPALNPLTAAQAAAGKTQGPATTAQIARALRSFTGTGSAAAWSAFASSSTTNPGIVTQLQGMVDQYRTAETLGSLTSGMASGLTAYQMQQFLPLASKSPAALGMLMNLGAQAGIPGMNFYDPSQSLAQNLQAAQTALKGGAYTSSQANQALNQMQTGGGPNHLTGLDNLTAMASNFLGVNGGSGTLAAAQLADASAQALAIRNSAFGGGVNKNAALGLQSDLASSGLSGGALKSSFGAALAQAGVSQNMIVKIEGQLHWNIPKPQIPPIPDVNVHVKLPPPVKIPVNAETAAAQAAINAIHANPVNVPVRESGVAAVQAAINSIHGGTVTETVRIDNQILTQYIGAATTPGGLAPATLVGAGGTRIHAQTGGLVPGTGSGDIIPAMLEPGEAIVPRYLVPMVAPLLAAHKVPGFGAPSGASHNFAAGGIAQSAPMSWTLAGSGGQLPLPAAVQKVLDQLLQSVATSPVWHDFGITLTGKMESSIKNLPAQTSKLASALVSKLVTETGYANNVANAAQQGQGYGTQGLISGMNVTPGTGGGSVYEQMQSYLAAEKSFTADIASLRKGGLNKDLIGQMIAAGPVQGDALAQSVTGSYGGIKGVNQLYAQIGAVSRALGAQAAMAQYGGHLSPTLQSGTITNNNISISLSGQSGTTLNLSANQIKSLTEIIQAKLLQQARRNQKTGVKAQGKSA